ncbi:MAG: hypothetical protein A3F14_06520 [Gammaproteobacteria bacterium RIFCSPHIGHO2_12_FULL_43_28]|nr:MAG: hypothetical protein A3F14_06520 [Gammaproteobacteria bacterium RIFCSPHIGHO2_12_FULL_43_28]
MEGNDALQLIFTRNAFYKRLHYLALGAFALTIVVIGILTWTLFYVVRNPSFPLYFATDSVGRLIRIVPVNQPNMPTEEVSEFAVAAAEAAFSYDFVNYRAQLQSAEKYFTRYGWREYMKALRSSNNILALTNRKQIVIAKAVEKPKLVREGVLGGAYAWRFDVPLLITYWAPPYDDSSKSLNALTLSMIIQRQPILESYQGLGVVQVVAQFADAGTGPREITNIPTG